VARTPEQVGRVRDRLAVVTRGGGCHAALAFVGGELADQIHAAADLERSHRLVVLVLHPQPRSGQRVEGRVAKQRSRPQVRRDAHSGREHVGEIGEIGSGHDSFYHVGC
jgi:hypothetical protein